MVLGLRWATTRVGVLNGHVGIPIRHGAIQWLTRKIRPRRFHLWLVQEARNGAELRAALGDKFACWPHEQPAEAKDTEAMTYVAYRKRRYDLIQGWNFPLASPTQYPRRLTAALLWDKRARRRVLAISLHVDPLGKGLAGASPAARNRQASQLREYADFIGEVKAAYQMPTSVYLGGDFNQRIGDRYADPEVREDSARVIFREVGLDPASARVANPGLVRLMDLFVPVLGGPVKVTSRTTHNIPVQGMDHEAVVVTTKIHKRRKRG